MVQSHWQLISRSPNPNVGVHVTQRHLCHRGLVGIAGRREVRDLPLVLLAAAIIGAERVQADRFTGSGHCWAPDDKLAEHKAEQRTIRLVIELRDQGLSYRQIVAELKRRRRVNRAGQPFVLAQIQRILRKR